MIIKIHDIFVAYASPDYSVAAKLVTELQDRGVRVCWDGSLQAEDSFETAIPRLLSSSRVFTILVSQATWDGQHYVTEELAVVIQLARTSGIAIVPVWLEPVDIEKRPYGISTKIGVSVAANNGCIGCVASPTGRGRTSRATNCCSRISEVTRRGLRPDPSEIRLNVPKLQLRAATARGRKLQRAFC